MRCQTAGRNQRSRGFHYVKLAFQLTLLAVFIWFLYQITHSNKDHLGNAETKFKEGHDAINLGRKQNVGQLSGVINTANQGDENVKVVGGQQEDRSGGDVEKKENEKELDKSYSLITKSVDNFESEVKVKEKDREVSSQENLQERLENPQRDVTNLDGVGDQKDLEKQINSDEQGDSKDLDGQAKKPHEDREISTHTVVESRDQVEGDNREHDGDKDLRSDKKLAMRPNGTDNNLVLSQSTEMTTEEIGFHDENGVPQDGSDALDFTITESRDGEANKVQYQEVKDTS
ncbi:hypothetical protein SLA2020_221420 [Shorea laevis]